MTTSYLCNKLQKFLFLVLLVLPALLFARLNEGPDDPNPDSLKQESLGHLFCIIRSDTDCVTKTVTLEAWGYYYFTGVSQEITVPWSTGVTAHKIIVEPPGVWSYDAAGIGCELVHQFNQVTYDSAFFSGPLTIEGPSTVCTPNPVLTVNTFGYNAFTSLQWNTNYGFITPYSIPGPGLYALTVTDAFGCVFSDDFDASPYPPGGEDCYDFCVTCNLDGTFGNNDGPPSSFQPVCNGEISIHNNVWYGFVAGSSQINIDVISYDCKDGNGLQIAVFDDCSDVDAIACNSGCGGCGGITQSVTYDNYTPGETYWLMIDGFVADVCDFEIDITDGSVTAPVPTQPAQIIGPVSVCQGSTAVYSISDAPGAGFYHWTAPPGSSINGLSNSISLDAPSGHEVSITFANSGGQVCVQSGNACVSSKGQTCLNVSVLSDINSEKAPLFLCHEALPYTWDEEPHTVLSTPGTYQLTSSNYSSAQGCDSIVRQSITINSPVITLLPTQYYCEDDCFQLTGMHDCDTIFTSAVFQSYRGCDSVVNHYTVFLNPIAEIIGPSEFFCGQSSLVLHSAPSPGLKAWRDSTGGYVGFGDDYLVVELGKYVFSTVLFANQLKCIKYDTIVITQNDTLLNVQITGASEGCNMDPLVLFADPGVNNAQFSWTGPDGFTSGSQNPIVTTTGDFSVTATTPGGCMGSASVNVPVIGGTPMVVTQGDTINCIESLGQLNGSSAFPGVTYFWTGPGNFQSNLENPIVSLPGAYQLVVTSPGGCSNSSIAIIEDQTSISSVEILNDSIICGAPVTLYAFTTAFNPTYNWAGPNGFQSTLAQPTVNEPGIYSLTVTDATSGCVATLLTTVIQDPFLLEISTDTIVYPLLGQNNGSIQISVNGNNGPFTYQWNHNGSLLAITEDVYNLDGGFYNVVITDAQGCASFESFVLLPTSATTEATASAPWIVRPNPGSGHFEICCNDEEKSIQELLAYDSNGRLVSQQTIHGHQPDISIDLSESPAGIYFLELREQSRNWWIRVVVQR